MRSWKKALVLALALLMLIGCGVSALAADVEVTGTPTVVTGINGTAQSTFKGTIVATTLSVSVPSTVNFTIDPSLEASLTGSGSGRIGQVIQPEILIINKSIVPITLSISACEDTESRLTGNSSIETGDKKVMIAIKHEGAKPADYDTPGNAWLMSGGLTDYSVLGTNAAVRSNTQIAINIYGKTTTGWTAGDTFTIKPTFVVAPSTIDGTIGEAIPG